jgi:LysR family nitrogen assimilation transcriptional regulator
MNLKTLRYFVAIADAGSLTGAAAAISIAQPALTRQLRELEADLGVPLFQRMPRGVRLTQAGVTLYESAQRILGEAQRVRQRLANTTSDSKTTVLLGVSPTLARVLLPGLFEHCLRTLPDVELRSREAFTPELLDWLERGMIDMAVVTNPGVGRSVSLYPCSGSRLPWLRTPRWAWGRSCRSPNWPASPCS